MHDKMSNSNTTSLVFSDKCKELDSFIKLPVSVTGMITHDHANIHFGHYSFDLFSHNSNYTIGLMTKLLHNLEQPPKSSSRELFVNI